jgi:hypothetical protein
MLHLWMPVGSGLYVRGSLAYRGYVPITAWLIHGFLSEKPEEL